MCNYQPHKYECTHNVDDGWHKYDKCDLANDRKPCVPNYQNDVATRIVKEKCSDCKKKDMTQLRSGKRFDGGSSRKSCLK